MHFKKKRENEKHGTKLAYHITAMSCPRPFLDVITWVQIVQNLLGYSFIFD